MTEPVKLSKLIDQAFESLAHSLRILGEADLRAHKYGLLFTDRDEAVGNLETGLTGVLNAFHSLYDAMNKEIKPALINWYKTPELAAILILRNARHHNLANRIRTIYSWHNQEVGEKGVVKFCLFVDYPPTNPEAHYSSLFVSWGDLMQLLSLPESKSQITRKTAKAVERYLNLNKLEDFSGNFNIPESRIFVNVFPLIINAAVKIVPILQPYLTLSSMESEAYSSLFSQGVTFRTNAPVPTKKKSIRIS